jgi:hypothetical protein
MAPVVETHMAPAVETRVPPTLAYGTVRLLPFPCSRYKTGFNLYCLQPRDHHHQHHIAMATWIRARNSLRDNRLRDTPRKMSGDASNLYDSFIPVE